MADLNTIMKYIKVSRLAAQGTDGERSNAQRIQARMQTEHPGIEEEARRVVAAQSGQPQTAAPFSDLRDGNWENIFGWAQQAAHVAYDFVQQATNAQYGTALAEQVTTYTKNTRAGRWLIGMRLDADVYWEAKQLNEAQKQTFRKELHAQLDEQLDKLLEPHEHTW